MLALPWVIERGPEIVLVVPAELAESLCARLKRYVLRARVELEVLAAEALAFATLGPAAPGSATPAHTVSAPGVSVLSFRNRTLLAGPAALLEPAVASLGRPRLTGNEWRRALIAAGEPDVVGEASEQWVAQMLNVDLTDGISFSKGCYTGQEIVARTQNLGRIKRRTLRYRATGATGATGATRLPAVLEPLRAGTAKVGEVVVAAETEDGFELLAVVALEARSLPLATAAGTLLEALPLPYPVP